MHAFSIQLTIKIIMCSNFCDFQSTNNHSFLDSLVLIKLHSLIVTSFNRKAHSICSLWFDDETIRATTLFCVHVHLKTSTLRLNWVQNLHFAAQNILCAMKVSTWLFLKDITLRTTQITFCCLSLDSSQMILHSQMLIK